MLNVPSRVNVHSPVKSTVHQNQDLRCSSADTSERNSFDKENPFESVPRLGHENDAYFHPLVLAISWRVILQFD